MSLIRWAILLASVVFYSVWFPDGPPPLHIRLDYDLVVIALIGFYRGPRVGAALGWIIGFLAQATDPWRLVWGGLFGSLLGWFVGIWSQRLFLENLWSRWIVLAIAFMTYKIFYLAIIMAGDWGGWLTSLGLQALPSTLIDATAGAALGNALDRLRVSRTETSAGATPAERPPRESR